MIHMRTILARDIRYAAAATKRSLPENEPPDETTDRAIEDLETLKRSIEDIERNISKFVTQLEYAKFIQKEVDHQNQVILDLQSQRATLNEQIKELFKAEGDVDADLKRLRVEAPLSTLKTWNDMAERANFYLVQFKLIEKGSEEKWPKHGHKQFKEYFKSVDLFISHAHLLCDEEDPTHQDQEEQTYFGGAWRPQDPKYSEMRQTLTAVKHVVEAISVKFNADIVLSDHDRLYYYQSEII